MHEIRAENSQNVSKSGDSVEPLVSADICLESFPWAPVRLAFLSGHPLALLKDPEPFRALVLLIANAWHKRPSMTAPNDDVQLAAMAGFGRDVEAWLAVRESVMQGWVLCCDGRWHHPELAAWAFQSWEAKKEHERFRAKQSERARGRGRQSDGHDGPERLPPNSRGSAAAQPYKKGQDTYPTEDDTYPTGDDMDMEGDEAWPEPGPSSTLTDGAASMHDVESGAQEESKEVDEDKDVLRIFDHWKMRTGRPDEKLTRSRKTIIQARLREGISPSLICRAIDNAAESDFYQGRTTKHSQRLDTLDVICRDADRIIRLASESVGQRRSGRIKQAAKSTAESFGALLTPRDPQEPEVIDVEVPRVRVLEGGVQ